MYSQNISSYPQWMKEAAQEVVDTKQPVAFAFDSARAAESARCLFYSYLTLSELSEFISLSRKGSKLTVMTKLRHVPSEKVAATAESKPAPERVRADELSSKPVSNDLLLMQPRHVQAMMKCYDEMHGTRLKTLRPIGKPPAYGIEGVAGYDTQTSYRTTVEAAYLAVGTAMGWALFTAEDGSPKDTTDPDFVTKVLNGEIKD